MALTMHDPVALRRYIDRTRELLSITPDAHAQALLRQMIGDAERQAAKRSRGSVEVDTADLGTGTPGETPPLPLGGTVMALHLMTDAQLNTGIRDASELAGRLVSVQADATQLLLAGIELAISELVTRSAQAPAPGRLGA